VVVWDATDPEVLIAEHELVGEVVGTRFRVPNLLVPRVWEGRILSTRSYFAPGQFADLLPAQADPSVTP